MAAGDLLTGATWEHELRAYLLNGATGPWFLDNVKGWLGGGVKSHDVELDLGDGAVSGTDSRAARILVFDWYCTEADDAAAFAAVRALETAWAPSTTDIALHATLPSDGHVYVMGRPRDLVIDDLRDTRWGRIDAQAFFYCGNPTITVVAGP